MTTRVVTQRNFNITSVKRKPKKRGADIPVEDILSIAAHDVNQRQDSTTRSIRLHNTENNEKLILSSDSVSLIDVVPVEVSNSSDESCIATIPLENEPNTEENANNSQVTAQIAVVQPDSPEDENEPHYITVTVSAPDGVGPHGSYQVQYVDQDIYNNSSQTQNQISYPFCPVGEYSANSQTYYSSPTENYAGAANNTTSGLPYIVPIEESIIVSSHSKDSSNSLTSENTFIQGSNGNQRTVHASINSLSETENPPNISHANRISPATVTWLMDNYETADGVSLPRSTLYNHYMQHCNENKLDAVNAASFGKLIRSVFNGLRTRRLGTRGNSKYHYYGIRLKPGSILTNTVEEKQPNNFNNSTNNSQIVNKGVKKNNKSETYEITLEFLGNGSSAIPVLPEIYADMILDDNISMEDIDAFRSIYREHCELFLDAILNLEFTTIESLWRDFWRASDNNNLDECEEEKYLSKTKLYQLCTYESVQNFIKNVDFNFYQNMVDVLLPDVLRPIPTSLTQSIRNFAKNLEIWLKDAMKGCPEIIIQIKLLTVSAFSQTLRRYTSLNHLAQAARAVLQNGSQIAQMLNDLNRVDFNNVQEQASWVCQCDTATVQKLEHEFKIALQQQNSLEQWAAWLRLVVNSALEKLEGKPNFANSARQFLLKWSFYSSMVIRDLTLRSAASFGSFHLIRLLYDEYMFFIIEHKVAETLEITPLAVMSEDNERFSKDFKSTENENYVTDFNIKSETGSKRIRN